MPTYDTAARLFKDFNKLTTDQQEEFRSALANFIDDLRCRRPFRPGLRVKRVQGTPKIWEMTWANNGRATWQYGDEIKLGEPHVIWRRIGNHDVLDHP